MPILPPLVDFGAISDFRDFQKGAFWTTLSAERSTIGHPAECRNVSGKRPCAERCSKINFYLLFSISVPFRTVFTWILPRFWVRFCQIFANCTGESYRERPWNVLGATRDPKWSQDAPRPDVHRFWTDFRRMLVKLCMKF